MGGWLGGQADYVMVPFADFNLLKFPDRDAGAGEDPRPDDAVGHLPHRLSRRVRPPGVTTGSTVYVAGAGPVGLAAAYSAQLLGAAVVIVGDLNADRLGQARSFGCETVDLSADAVRWRTRSPRSSASREVDCAVDAVGFEARGHGTDAGEATGHGAQLDHEPHPGRRQPRHPGPVRHRRSRRRRRRRQDRAR